MGCRLIGVVASSVQVVDVEAKGQPFVGIYREIGLETFFTVLLAACLVIGQIGERNVTVGKLEVARAEIETREGSHEHGVSIIGPFEEQA